MQDIFKALADQSRRHLLDKLRQENGLTLGQLCEELNMSRQAVSKHLVILEQANLVIAIQKGRKKHHFLNAVPLQQVVDRWVGEFRQVQTQALLQLKQDLEKENE
jgi:DNA-binding transcriptional ArsR family regulator